MKPHGTRFSPFSPRAVLVSLCATCVCAAAAERETFTYHSPEVGCDFLALEYQTIKTHTNPDKKEPPAVTKEGAMMTFGMLFSLPAILFGEVFGPARPRYDFSRDPDDLSAAAEDKECAALLELIAADRRGGTYPPPLKSNVR
ncbi:MAG: hypothetical protein ACR2QC_09935 [Gammaproteobacteria bacterium]